MSLILDGTNGLSDVDGTAAAPAIRGTDTNTGIFFPAADTIAFAEGGTEVARIDSAGNLGIGTSSPSFPLDVAGAIRGNSWIGRANTSAPTADAFIFRPADNTLGLGTGNTERMRIDSSGTLLIGTTSASAGVRLRVAGGIIGCLDVFNNTSGAGANLNIDSNGFFARSTSSLKYKKDIQEANHGLTEILQLRPVTYKSKSERDGDTIFGGLIAEEVHEVGLTEFVQYAEDGSPDALAYGNMVSLCVKAIQELNAKVDAQAARIAALENPPVESVTNE